MDESALTQPMVMTVTGPITPTQLGITDAHTHVWIEPVPGTQPGLPQLFDQSGIAAELKDYRKSGGKTLVDCQPGGCGRNGAVLKELSRLSGAQIVACTGFHLRKYYAPTHWIYQPDVRLEKAKTYFVSELVEGLGETRKLKQPVWAGFIKIACEAAIGDTPAVLMEAAALAGIETGVAIEVHTEQGSDAENICARFQKLGFPLEKFVICHLDKRPDFGLHRELAQHGITLEYDTFYRKKYNPDKNVWPLLEQMIGAGLARQIVLATDMAEASMWSRLGGKPGQTAFTKQIMGRLQTIGIEKKTIQQLMGGNIANVLAYPLNQTHNNQEN